MEPADEVLMQRFQAGDPTAFACLYQRHLDWVRSLLRGRGLPPGEVDDVAQETFIQLHKQAARFNPELGTFRPWLRKIVVWRHADHCRVLGRVPVSIPENFPPQQSPPIPDPVENSEVVGQLRESMRTLPKSLREVLDLTLREMSRSEIADQLRIPVGTVDSRRNDGKSRLRDCLKKHGISLVEE